LIRQSFVIADAKACLGSCGVAETSNHLFLGCDFSQSLWRKIRLWLDVYGPLSNVVED
jgi:hypothetical protein